LKYFLKVDFLLSLPTIQKGVCIPPPLREEVSTPISNGLERIMNLS
jgi:hypothetical protein